MGGCGAVFRRELLAYFATPVAYVFLAVFLFLAGVTTFYFGDFFGRGQADLQAFFAFHPWLYLFLIPALSMRLWAEERRAGTIEVLLTLPLSGRQLVLGKFFAAWVFVLVSLVCTFPLWWTVNLLGTPDNGVIAVSYIGSALMAAAYLSVGSLMSALTRNQVVAFVMSLLVCMLLALSGYPLVLDAFSGWASTPVLQAVSRFSFLSRFGTMIQGVVVLDDVVFFVSITLFFLYLTALVLRTGRVR